jgi:hypothetical protein
MNMLELALSWWKKGWNVIPVDAGKHPAIERWKQWISARQTEDEVKQINWLKSFKKEDVAGVGGITGVVAEGAANYVALDCDVEGLKHSKKFVDDIHPTRKHNTLSGGNHLIMLSIKPCASTDKFKAQFGFELQGIGNYIVLPGSFDGKYKVDNEAIPIHEEEDIEELILELAKTKGWKPREEDAKGIDPSEMPAKELKCERFFIDNVFPRGSRHNVLGKNFAVHLYSVDDEEFISKEIQLLAAAQQDFAAEDITSWKSWVAVGGKTFNCLEVAKYLKKYHKPFSCRDCALHGGVELREKAERILKEEDPLEFIADTVEIIHYHDRELSKIVWLSTTTPGLGYELFIFSVGKSGIGKSDLLFIVLLTVPDEYVVAPTEISQKAIYYYVLAKKKSLDKCVIYFDDAKFTDIELLKSLASDNRRNPELWSVDIDRKFMSSVLEGDWTVFASAVEPLTDRQQQLLRRYVMINPDETEETNRLIVEKIKEDMRMGKSRREIPEEFKVAQYVTKAIKELPCKVLIPFDFEFPSKDSLSRTEVKQFSTLLWAIAKARSFQRLKLGNNILAQLEDFDTAVNLWNEIQPLKIDKMSARILDILPEEEPVELADGSYTKFMTKTDVAKLISGLGASTAVDKLELLYQLDLVDRKPVTGRGSPYAYWKTSSLLLSFAERRIKTAPIKLKNPKEEATLSFPRFVNAVSKKMSEKDKAEAASTAEEYLLRLEKYCPPRSWDGGKKELPIDSASLAQQSLSLFPLAQNTERKKESLPNAKLPSKTNNRIEATFVEANIKKPKQVCEHCGKEVDQLFNCHNSDFCEDCKREYDDIIEMKKTTANDS